MSNHASLTTYNPTQWYLEIARGAFQGIHHPKSIEEIAGKPEHAALQNAVMALMSMTIIYSYLAVESFVNYQLYRVWEQRTQGTSESKRFIEICGEIDGFEELKKHKKLIDTGNKLKVLARVLGITKPNEALPGEWNKFKQLAEASRHFIVHPFPDKAYFQDHMANIGTKVEGGLYLNTAVALISYFYEKTGIALPDYLTQNTLIRFRGVDLLPGRGGDN